MFRLLLDPDAQGAAGDGSSSAQQAQSTTATTPAVPAGDPTEGYKKLLEKHQNDASRVAEKLYDENHSHRQTIRELKAKVPGDGSLVLNADQAKAWTAYLELGKPEEIHVLKSEHGQFATERQAAAREKFHGEIAEAHGYKASVLSRLIDQDQIEVELKDASVNGKTVKVAHVKDGDQFTPLPDYAKAHWADFLEVLPKAPETKAIGTPRSGLTLPRTSGETAPPRISFVR